MCLKTEFSAWWHLGFFAQRMWTAAAPPITTPFPRPGCFGYFAAGSAFWGLGLALGAQHSLSLFSPLLGVVVVHWWFGTTWPGWPTNGLRQIAPTCYKMF